MTRDYDSDQSPLWVRSELVRVDLVHLITYSDRENSTVDTHFYFARAPTLFDYDNGGTDVDFWPYLKEIGSLSTSINHLPSQDDTGLLHKTLEITLTNEMHGDDYLINILRDSHTLENASIEWTQLALSDRPTTTRIDLTDLDGDEHTFRYRGRVVQVGPVTRETITLRCDTEMSSADWPKDQDATKNDPRDYGRRLPLPYGSDVLVRCNGSEVGWVTTLAETIDSDDTGSTEFTDCSGMSGMSADAMRIGNEEVLATYVDATHMNITARGQQSTTATAHGRGEIAIEMITTATFTAAGCEVDAINEVYIRNPASGELVRLQSGDYTANTANTTFVSGETRATVAFAVADLRTILGEFFADVSGGSSGGSSRQQPISVSTGSPTADRDSVRDGQYDGTTDYHIDTTASNQDVTVAFADPGTFTWQTVRAALRQSASGNHDTEFEVNSTVIGTVASADKPGTGSDPEWFSFGTDEVSNTIVIHGDVSAGTTRGPIYEIERIVGASITSLSQTADSATSNMGGVNADAVRDGNESSYVTLTNNYYVEVVFPTPDVPYISQRIRVYADDLSDCEINVGGVQQVDFQPVSSASGWFEFETDAQSDTVRIIADGTITVNLIERDVLSLSGSPVIEGAAVGFNLEVWASVDGALAPSATHPYKAGSGSLMTKPCDIMRHWIEGRVAPPSTISATHMLGTYVYGFGTSITTTNLVPAADMTFLLAINDQSSAGEPNTPSVTGGGLGTWTLVDSNYYKTSSPYGKLFVFSASSSSPGSMAPVVIDFGAQTQTQASYSIDKFPGTDITTDDGVVQSDDNNTTGTSLTVTLGTFDETANATYGAFGSWYGGTNEFTEGSGFSEIHEETQYAPMLAEYKGSNDTSVDATITSSANIGGIAVELAATGTSYSPSVEVDTDSYDDCNTNLGSDAWAFDARTLGFTREEVLARMGFEARTTFVPEETSSGTVWKMLTALSTYAFGSASGSITEWERGGFVEADQNTNFAHATRFVWYYAPDWSKGDGEEAFTGIVVANQDTNDLSVPSTANFQTAVDKLGDYEADPVGFRCIQVEATAEEIAGYYAHERIRVPIALYAISGVPWWEAYALEVGDIVEVTPPWAASATKCRVIEYVKDPSTEQIELRLVEVE